MLDFVKSGGVTIGAGSSTLYVKNTPVIVQPSIEGTIRVGL